jgi:hypothetical protein
MSSTITSSLDRYPYLIFTAGNQPPFGGIQTKTAHIFHALGLEKKKVVYSHGKRVENFFRDFGYGLKRRNIPTDLIKYFPRDGNIFIAEFDRDLFAVNEDNLKLDNITLSLVDTHYYNGASEKIIEKMKSKWSFVAIRKTIANFYEKKFGVKVECIPHIWYKFPIKPELKKYVDDISLKKGAIACCRLDFKKKVEIIFDANDNLPPENICYVHGASTSRVYNYSILKLERLKKYWRGAFEKSFDKVSEIHAPAKFGVNLSDFPADGGGTENTTLEYIYHNTAVILHRNWIKKGKEFSEGSEFEEGYNCFAVESSEELAELLRKNPDTDSIVKEARKIIDNHTSNKLMNDWGRYVK